MIRLTAILFLATFCSFSLADKIIIPIGKQGSSELIKPEKGQSKSSVVEQFGEPNNKLGPTGQPPISTWRYQRFTVYFENDTVIHSVSRHTSQP